MRAGVVMAGWPIPGRRSHPIPSRTGYYWEVPPDGGKPN
jgi:hypothetical protein